MSSEEVKGKVVAKEVVSMLRVIMRRSWAVGRVVLKASSIWRLAVLAMIIREPRVDWTCRVVLLSSSRDLAGMVM